MVIKSCIFPKQEAAEVTEASKTLFRPSSANSSRGDVGRRVRTSSATDPMARVKGKRVQKAFFFTEDGKQQVGKWDLIITY